ncbi:DUF4355 domain-containing protein [Streptococcus danieliae]|uniref:DUF4355 domain-containing protein n=1 Tax=Streptococcus danieliae TaxID=747656 RepID=A0A7Z0M6M6_9STRE|nr:DUF4355 domain-containing protein [Streptococcus danieliae]MBF0699673.1 DUF4355 domain-containing protein [Streptococcus danieliae]NYS96849.1 DUF4355 domain-containing protein [Streptococcus danieliae]
MSEENQNQSVDEQQEVEATESEAKQGRLFTRDDVAKMLKAERTKWEDGQAKALEEARTEGERLARLSKDQRAKEEQEKREQAIQERENAIALKELRLETRDLLATEGLPSEFLDIVLAPTAEEVTSNIEALRKVFDEEVEKKVNARLVQKTARTGNSSSGMSKSEIMAIKDDDERQRLIAENRSLFTQK